MGMKVIQKYLAKLPDCFPCAGFICCYLCCSSVRGLFVILTCSYNEDTDFTIINFAMQGFN